MERSTSLASQAGVDDVVPIPPPDATDGGNTVHLLLPASSPWLRRRRFYGLHRCGKQNTFGSDGLPASMVCALMMLQ